MAVTPRGRSRTASASASPSKSNGRKQPIALDMSDDEVEVDEQKSAKNGRSSPFKHSQKAIEVQDDDGDDEEQEEYEVEAIREHRRVKAVDSVSCLSTQRPAGTAKWHICGNSRTTLARTHRLTL